MRSITITVSRPAAAGGPWRVLSSGSSRDFPDDPQGRDSLEDHIVAILSQLLHDEPPAAAPPLFTQEHAERLAETLLPQGYILRSCEAEDCEAAAIHRADGKGLCQRHMDLWSNGGHPEYGGSDGPG